MPTSRENFELEPTLWDLRSGLSLYKWDFNPKIQGKLTYPPPSPALLAIKNNIFLPSYENQDIRVAPKPSDRIQNPNPEPLAKTAIDRPLLALRESIAPSYSRIDWLGGLYVLPIINTIYIAISTYAEFIFRSLAATAMALAHIFHRLINESQNRSDTTKFILNRVVDVVCSPLWCIGQTLSMAADVIAYSKQLLDSTIRIVNPLWWVSKIYDAIYGGNKYNPSFKSVVSTFVSSVVKLLPAALIITTGVLTAGISVPILHAIAGPLQVFGSAIANAVVGAVATMASGVGTTMAAAVGYTYVSGAVAAVSKLFSGSIGALTNIMFPPKKFDSDSKSSRPSKKSNIRKIKDHKHEGDVYTIEKRLGLSSRALSEEAQQNSQPSIELSPMPKTSSPSNVAEENKRRPSPSQSNITEAKTDTEGESGSDSPHGSDIKRRSIN